MTLVAVYLIACALLCWAIPHDTRRAQRCND